MYITELVAQHGTSIVVSCGQTGYPPFRILEHLGGKKFRCEYPDGKEFELNDCLGDYSIVSESSDYASACLKA